MDQDDAEVRVVDRPRTGQPGGQVDVVVQRVQRRNDDLRRQQVTRGEQHQQGTPERDLHPGQRERQERRQEQRDDHARYRDVERVQEVPAHRAAGPRLAVVVEVQLVRQGEVPVLLGLRVRTQRRVQEQEDRQDPQDRHEPEERVQHHPGRPGPVLVHRHLTTRPGRRSAVGRRRVGGDGGHRLSSRRRIWVRYVITKPVVRISRITATADPYPIRLASPMMLSTTMTASSSSPLRPPLIT